jgi:micrococcal nuclease
VPAVVTEINDGDTLNVTIAGTPAEVRMIGLDTPNLGECFYVQGQLFTRGLVEEMFVLLEEDDDVDDTNDDGQLLRHVWLPNGQFISYELLVGGYAVIEDTDNTYQQVLGAAEEEAQDEEKGFWQPDDCDGER